MPFLATAADLQPVPEIRRIEQPTSTAGELHAQAATSVTPTDTQPEGLPQSYPYASLSAGVGFPSSISGPWVPGPTITGVTNQFSLNTGFAGELAAGYKFPEARAELAVGYGDFATSGQTITVPGGSVSPTGSGNVNYVSVLINGYYDFPTRQTDGTYSPWRPYIGAGIGYASVTTPACFGGACFQGGSAGAFAYQGKVGLSYRAAEKGDIFLEGAYLGTTGFTVDTVSYDNLGAFRIALGWRQGF